MMGGPGMMGPGMGMMGPGMGMGAGGVDLGLAAATKRYHTTIKVRTNLVYLEPKAKTPAAPSAAPADAPPGASN